MNDHLGGPLTYAPQRIREEMGITRLSNVSGSLMAVNDDAQEIVDAPVQSGDDLALKETRAVDVTSLQSFGIAGSDAPTNVFRGDLGLTALISDLEATRASLARRRTNTVPLDNLRPSPRTPRQKHSDDEICELARSIRQRGILQPIIVRPIRDLTNEYEIIAGERRWRAAKRAGLYEVPIIIRDVDDVESFELAIIENLQRTDLSPLEQASAYQVMIEHYGYTKEDVANVIGKSRSFVANTLRLLELPEKVMRLLESGKLTGSHARTLVGQSEAEGLAEEIIKLKLNVRQVEERVERTRRTGTAQRGLRSQSNARLASLQQRLCDLVGLSVTIDHRTAGGVLRIRYADLEQLEELANKLQLLRSFSDTPSET